MKTIILILISISLAFGQSSKKFFYFFDDDAVKSIVFTGTATGNIVMQGTGAIKVEWGDGSVNNYTLTGSDQNISHTYSSGTYNIKIWNSDRITKWHMNSNTGTWTISSKGLPNLTYLYLRNLSGTQTINSSNLPKLTYLYLLNLSGTQTINSGHIPGVTYLYLNNISGTQTINSYDIPKVTVLYLLLISGIQTIDLTDIPKVYDLYLMNINGIYSGNLSSIKTTAANIIYQSSGKSFDITAGTMPAWANTTITITPTGTGYTTAEIDAFLNAWALTAGSGTKTIDLRGANQPRSSNSDAAVSTLNGLGKTILTNP